MFTLTKDRRNRREAGVGEGAGVFTTQTQSFISSINDCMLIVLPEAQYKVFWTGDELIKLNAVTPLLLGVLQASQHPA